MIDSNTKTTQEQLEAQNQALQKEVKELKAKLSQAYQKIENTSEDKDAVEKLDDTPQPTSQKLELVLESISEIFMILNTDGTFAYINKEAENYFGKKSAEIEGITIWKTFPSLVGSGFYYACMLALDNSEYKTVDCQIFEKWYEVKFSSIKNGIAIFLNDITERKTMETTLREDNQAKDKFFSIIAHDLKSPFNSMLGVSALLQNKDIDLSKEDLCTILEHFVDSTHKLRRLVDSLLVWSKIQMKQTSVTWEQLNLDDILRNVTEIYQKQAEGKDINVITHCDHNSHPCLGDCNIIETVIRNLLSNALKFTPNHGSITISTAYSDDNLTISIQDTGVGMSPEVLNKLFRISEKVSLRGTNGESGTGLGLTICKELIQKHGGQLKVQSTEGKGSVFTFRIPQKK